MIPLKFLASAGSGKLRPTPDSPSSFIWGQQWWAKLFIHTVLVEFMVTSPVPRREAVKARYRDTLVVVKRVVPPKRIRQKRRGMFDLSTVASSRGEETERGTGLSDIIVNNSSFAQNLDRSETGNLDTPEPDVEAASHESQSRDQEPPRKMATLLQNGLGSWRITVGGSWSSRSRELVADGAPADSLTSRRTVSPAISSAFHQRLLTNFTAEMRRLVVVRHPCIVSVRAPLRSWLSPRKFCSKLGISPTRWPAQS